MFYVRDRLNARNAVEETARVITTLTSGVFAPTMLNRVAGVCRDALGDVSSSSSCSSCSSCSSPSSYYIFVRFTCNVESIVQLEQLRKKFFPLLQSAHDVY